MIRLLPADPDRYNAWATCLREFDGGPMDGSGYDFGEVPEVNRQGFHAYLEKCRTEEDLSIAPAPSRVHCSYRWVVDGTWDSGGPILGFVAIRHTLTPFLHVIGGHIGYCTLPSARGTGIAKAALQAAVREAATLGIDSVLVTCVEENVASQRVIEHNGGIYQNSVQEYRRYWI